MTDSPLPIIGALTLAIVFQAIFFAAEAGDKAFPTFEQPGFAEGECDGPIKAVVCGAKTIIRLVTSIWGVVVFVVDIITFNISGAPWWARVVISTLNITGISWLIARLIRGGG